jgi:hypothetical protein
MGMNMLLNKIVSLQFRHQIAVYKQTLMKIEFANSVAS